MKAVVFTLGCKVNECESDSLISGLIDRGYEVSDKLVPADLYIVNTCAVTAEAEKKSRQTASRILKLNSNAKIIYTGCAVQKNPSQFQTKKMAKVITGTFSKNKILDLLDKEGTFISPEDGCFEELLPPKTLRTRTYIKVQDGCNNFCTYCIIPHLRGRIRSRNPKSVVDEITALSPLEAVINGINLSAYNYEGQNLTALMHALKDVDCRIRLGSLEVGVIDDDFLQALKSLKNFAPHFHLSLQSGSNKVLKSMNRHYTREEYMDRVNLIRSYFPDAGITTDIIVGFPTESDQDFLDTLDLTEKVHFSDIHPFIFSPRQGTPAYKMQDLPSDLKKSRLDKLLEKKTQLKTEFALKELNKTRTVIVEEYKDGYTGGYTENYLRVYITGDVSDKKPHKVKIKQPFRDGVIGEIIND